MVADGAEEQADTKRKKKRCLEAGKARYSR